MCLTLIAYTFKLLTFSTIMAYNCKRPYMGLQKIFNKLINIIAYKNRLLLLLLYVVVLIICVACNQANVTVILLYAFHGPK